MGDLAVLVPHQAALGEHVRWCIESFDGSPHDFLRAAESIDCGGIDPVEPKVNSLLNCRDRVAIILRPPAELPFTTTHRPGAYADGSNKQIAVTELFHFHVRRRSGYWVCTSLTTRAAKGDLVITEVR